MSGGDMKCPNEFDGDPQQYLHPTNSVNHFFFFRNRPYNSQSISSSNLDLSFFFSKPVLLSQSISTINLELSFLSTTFTINIKINIQSVASILVSPRLLLSLFNIYIITAVVSLEQVCYITVLFSLVSISTSISRFSFQQKNMAHARFFLQKNLWHTHFSFFNKKIFGKRTLLRPFFCRRKFVKRFLILR